MTNKQLIDDQRLVELYIKGNEHALETLITRHKKRVFTYIMMIVRDQKLAEDIFQDTFVKIIQTLKRGHYNEEGKFLPWVLRIAHNLVIDHFRKEKKMPTVSGGSNEDGEEYSIFDTMGEEEKTSEDKIIQKQSKKDLRELVERLPLEQREVLMMRHYYDMSFKEIADKTNVSINTALGRMRYALINMRKMMEEKQLTFAR
jgi:RNA polymerase sigma factor (sigma-70 family)